jgi:uncharacterized protein DUF5615
MLRLAADENFNGDIVRGLLRRNPQLDIVRVQDVGLSGADDPSILEWAARENRIVVTHDISTLAKHAFDRVAAGRRLPGVFAVRSVGRMGQTIEDLCLLAECSLEGEWEGAGPLLALVNVREPPWTAVFQILTSSIIDLQMSSRPCRRCR